MIGIHSTTDSIIARSIYNFIGKLTSSKTAILSDKQIENRQILNKLEFLIIEGDATSNSIIILLTNVLSCVEIPIIVLSPSQPSEILADSPLKKVTLISTPIDEVILYQNLRKQLDLNLLDKAVSQEKVLPFSTYLGTGDLTISIPTPILEISEQRIIAVSAAYFPLKCRLVLKSELFDSVLFDNVTAQIDQMSIRHPKNRLLPNEIFHPLDRFPFIIEASIQHKTFKHRLMFRKWIYELIDCQQIKPLGDNPIIQTIL